ncbi:MAG: hypothetical protein HN855_16180 [Anaerolineae bacterium]|nr:hypothetical protein [Anaerolineae bacterium]
MPEIEEEPEPIPTFTPTPEPLICVQPLTPEDGAELPYIGKVIFSWTEMGDITDYILEITMPSGDLPPIVVPVLMLVELAGIGKVAARL